MLFYAFFTWNPSEIWAIYPIQTINIYSVWDFFEAADSFLLPILLYLREKLVKSFLLSQKRRTFAGERNDTGIKQTFDTHLLRSNHTFFALNSPTILLKNTCLTTKS
jgi:hypothetical protein